MFRIVFGGHKHIVIIRYSVESPIKIVIHFSVPSPSLHDVFTFVCHCFN